MRFGMLVFGGITAWVCLTMLYGSSLHRRCLALDPADPRTYVILGKTLLQQRRYDEARVLYQDACANTGQGIAES